MEAEELMILRDLPVDTRNYTIVDNITGKPIDQSTYTLTIDTEVIGKLNKLKQVNEEKIRQAALRDQYGNDTLVSTFTPDDNAVFTPVYNDEYIDYHDFNKGKEEEKEVVEEVVEDVVEEIENPTGAEVIMSDTLLERVVARDQDVRRAEEAAKAEAEAQEANKPELDYISAEDFAVSADTTTANETDNSIPADNSLFTPEMATLQQASEQIVNIDTKKLGQDIKSKAQREGTEKIKLDKMEIISGRGIAWLAYFLFFIPLLFKRKNRFVRLHANEGLELNIVELLSAILIGQYFLLPRVMETMSSTMSTISMWACIIGAGLLGACILTIIPMIIFALFGKNPENPWLWHKRIIHVSTERTSD